MNHLNRMLYGSARQGVKVGEARGWGVIALGACALVLAALGLAALGLALPQHVTALLHQSVASLIR